MVRNTKSSAARHKPLPPEVRREFRALRERQDRQVTALLQQRHDLEIRHDEESMDFWRQYDKTEQNGVPASQEQQVSDLQNQQIEPRTQTKCPRSLQKSASSIYQRSGVVTKQVKTAFHGADVVDLTGDDDEVAFTGFRATADQNATLKISGAGHSQGSGRGNTADKTVANTTVVKKEKINVNSFPVCDIFDVHHSNKSNQDQSAVHPVHQQRNERESHTPYGSPPIQSSRNASNSASTPGTNGTFAPYPVVQVLASRPKTNPASELQLKSMGTVQANQAQRESSPVHAKSISQNPDNPKTPPSRKLVLADSPTVLSNSDMQQQRCNRSPILKDPARLTGNQKYRQLHALESQQRNGEFVSNILHNGRGQSWAPGLGSALSRPFTVDAIQSTGQPHQKPKVTVTTAGQIPNPFVRGQGESTALPLSRLEFVARLSAHTGPANDLGNDNAYTNAESVGPLLHSIEGFKRPTLPGSASASASASRSASVAVHRSPTAASVESSADRKRKNRLNLSDDSDAELKAPGSDTPKAGRSTIPTINNVPAKRAKISKYGYREVSSGGTSENLRYDKASRHTSGVPGSAISEPAPVLQTPQAANDFSRPQTPSTPVPNRTLYLPPSPISESPSARVAAARFSRPVAVASSVISPSRVAKAIAESRIKMNAEESSRWFRLSEDEQSAELEREKSVGERLGGANVTPRQGFKEWTAEREMGDRFLAKDIEDQGVKDDQHKDK